ncbi:tetratricopeptide repeat protein [Vibrio cholerae]|uniref:tetratricopeptide repeat protein n=1 Tax=Vibrio cholerae TaxID=666 RepID=UPI0011DAC746|nr:tetratricopeptide repeat protein [Vibrio cholerae]EGR0442909.1 tetratricopeptide repeat protein [Vibrio cholerae]EGR0451457.1 tetratricopeptide repeat protein [Vibrio cholerae]EJR5448076.1 tetratricopeptide repeat protein [Vibrio cholerae]EKF9199299.1 tetratricopeptide repeat protein [Vibrio cholerae]EKF9996610.1 tetratricopeptide repeat protein [Vibrio cholerae]
MKKIFLEQLSLAKTIENDNEKLVYLTAILRSLLQTSVVCLFDISKALTPSDEIDLSDLISKFCKPTDGMPVQIIDTLTPVLRTYVDRGILRGWFEAEKQLSLSVSKQMIQWVEFRNKRPGHGVLDIPTASEWAVRTEKLIFDCLFVFDDIIPVVGSDGEILPLSKFENIKITPQILSKGHAIVILNITPRKGVWKLKGQLLSRVNAEEFTAILPENNVFNTNSLKPVSQYDLVEISSNNKSYSLFHNVPVRQTDTFEGRKEELFKLKEWMEDEDSRYCLVYGDGGYGKTTLVLEMLNQFIESNFDFREPLPTIISYHTAKMTRWNENGLSHLTSVIPLMDECIRDLMRFFEPVLKQDWYTVSDKKLIDKAVNVLKENKLTRDDILLIIDNTETLATTSEEVKNLGMFFKLIGKFIGRVIITSRRREFIEATPILVGGLSEIEGVNLMRRLAEDFNARPIIQAGEAKLRKVSSQMMHKPILLEALVKYISHSGLGIENAVDNVFKKTNEDLLEFLYEDAWLRMNSLQKEVFFVLINLSSPINQNTVSKTCLEVGIQHAEFQSGLEETHFSILTDYGKTYNIELVELARRFFLQQYGKLDSKEKDRFKLVAEKVDSYAVERDKIEREYQTDRISEAFRSEYAKSAKVYADRGDIVNAISMYELAIEDDPVNSSLHDRFSWFLLNKANKFEYAKKMSERAVSLDENNCDAIVGLALSYYRLGDIKNGDKQIDEAEKKGRSPSFSLLRKSIARYHKSRDIGNIDGRITILEEALAFLEKAERLNRGNNGYNAKNGKDIQKYKEMTRKQLMIYRGKRTKLIGLL